MKRILTYGLLTLAVVLIGLGAWLYLEEDPAQSLAPVRAFLDKNG